MDRFRSPRRSPHVRRPHARGDGPHHQPHTQRHRQQAPRTWGWTDHQRAYTVTITAGPTHVGMDRTGGDGVDDRGRRPHARGDGPEFSKRRIMTCLQAPRTWGWTAPRRTNPGRSRAGPTHVGMDRGSPPTTSESCSRPHARGDGPVFELYATPPFAQAPRTWGWTGIGLLNQQEQAAGPTHVGMDRWPTWP